MTDISDIVLPVFVLAMIGYICIKTGFFSEATGDGLTSYVFNLAIPVVLFRSMAAGEISGSGSWQIWLSYLPGIVVAWIGAIALVAGLVKRGYRASVIAGVAAGFSNLVLVGTPLIERAYGPEGLAIHFVLIAVHLPFMMAVSTFLMEFAVRADGVEKSALSATTIGKNLLKNLAVNPIIIGILLGIFWRTTGFGIDGSFAQIIDLISRTAGPMALIALGMGFAKYSIRGNWQPAIGLALMSVWLMPAVVLFTGIHVFALPALELKVVVLAAACPTGVNAYLFANYFKVAEGLASSSIVFAALISLISLPFWLSVLSVY